MFVSVTFLAMLLMPITHLFNDADGTLGGEGGAHVTLY